MARMEDAAEVVAAAVEVCGATVRGMFVAEALVAATKTKVAWLSLATMAATMAATSPKKVAVGAAVVVVAEASVADLADAASVEDSAVDVASFAGDVAVSAVDAGNTAADAGSLAEAVEKDAVRDAGVAGVADKSTVPRAGRAAPKLHAAAV